MNSFSKKYLEKILKDVRKAKGCFWIGLQDDMIKTLVNK
jgi:hypothetical protein